MKIITIDGPASSGKGTVAKEIASYLRFNYLDSGSMYRCLGFAALSQGVKEYNVQGLANLAKLISVVFDPSGQIILNGQDVTTLIREEKVGMMASKVAKIPEVRAQLLDFQRSFAKEPGLVTDGRDMGSVVFPEADLKIFLTASAEARAIRRLKQLEQMGIKAKFEEILNGIILRDKQDSERAIAPLSYDKSYKVLDNSELTIEDTVKQVLSRL